jgi:superfamily I DNA/RNA helicase
MPWIPERASFDDEQNRIFDQIIEDTQRSWWIKGYAGTGKTMLLVHLANEYIKAGYDCAYVTYTHALKNLVNEALVDLGNEPNGLPVFTVDTLNSLARCYDLVFVDEVQDLPERKIRNLLSKSERFIFAGDLNQSIFLNSAKPDNIKKLLGNPKIVELRDIHRLPEAISFASHLIYDEADSAENAMVDVVEDSSVNIVSARSVSKEVSWIYEQALKESRPSRPSAILFSKHKELQEFLLKITSSNGLGPLPRIGKMKIGGGHDYNDVNKFLKKNGLSLMYFGGTGGGEINAASKSRIVLAMTLHSAKGLEFDSVFLPFMNSDRLPCPYPH